METEANIYNNQQYRKDLWAKYENLNDFNMPLDQTQALLDGMTRAVYKGLLQRGQIVSLRQIFIDSGLVVDPRHISDVANLIKQEGIAVGKIVERKVEVNGEPKKVHTYPVAKVDESSVAQVIQQHPDLAIYRSKGVSVLGKPLDEKVRQYDILSGLVSGKYSRVYDVVRDLTGNTNTKVDKLIGPDCQVSIIHRPGYPIVCESKDVEDLRAYLEDKVRALDLLQADSVEVVGDV